MHPPFAPGQLARQPDFLDTNNNAILSFLNLTLQLRFDVIVIIPWSQICAAQLVFCFINL